MLTSDWWGRRTAKCWSLVNGSCFLPNRTGILRSWNACHSNGKTNAAWSKLEIFDMPFTFPTRISSPATPDLPLPRETWASSPKDDLLAACWQLGRQSVIFPSLIKYIHILCIYIVCISNWVPCPPLFCAFLVVFFFCFSCLFSVFPSLWQHISLHNFLADVTVALSLCHSQTTHANDNSNITSDKNKQH